MKYRKRPTLVEATRWWKNGDHPQDESVEQKAEDGSVLLTEGKVVRRYRHPDVPGGEECGHCGNIMADHGWIDTLEGGHIVCPGDWIITGVEGERYPCKPDIFEKTYETVDGDPMPDGEESVNWLGVATSRELLGELTARIEMGRGLDHRRSDEEKPTPPEGRVVMEGMEGER